MPPITKRTLNSLLFAGTLICFTCVAAQQSPSQRTERTQSVKPQSTQATPQQQNDRLAQLQMQVKDLQAAIDDLRSEQQMIEATTKESHELILDSRLVQKQDRQDLNSVLRTASQDERKIDQLGQQVSSLMLDLRRVKTKVGLY
jgi:cell division protein FtsB